MACCLAVLIKRYSFWLPPHTARHSFDRLFSRFFCNDILLRGHEYLALFNIYIYQQFPLDISSLRLLMKKVCWLQRAFNIIFGHMRMIYFRHVNNTSINAWCAIIIIDGAYLIWSNCAWWFYYCLHYYIAMHIFAVTALSRQLECRLQFTIVSPASFWHNTNYHYFVGRQFIVHRMLRELPFSLSP